MLMVKFTFLPPSAKYLLSSVERSTLSSFRDLKVSGCWRPGPTTSSGQADSTVHGSEPGMVMPWYVVVSTGRRWMSRPNKHMWRWAGYDYCVTPVTAEMTSDHGTAGKGDCQYYKYDGRY